MRPDKYSRLAIMKLRVPSAVILRKGVFEMERDTFDAAIDEILAFTSGDIRLALRAILIESVLLEEKLRQIHAASANGNSTEEDNSLH
jgi:hypothetical protein